MKGNRFSKPVAFNITNAIDKTILEHVKNRNFSGYVKKLILSDIAKKGIGDKPNLSRDRINNQARSSSNS